MTTNRQEWIRNKVHCNNKIICILDQYFPEFQSVFKDISGKSSMQILSKYPLPEDILSVDIETLRNNTKIANGKRRISKTKIVALYTFAQNTIGITNDVDRRLFGEHNVDKNHAWWIYRTAVDKATAQVVEEHFLSKGMKGETGGGTDDTIYVYCYEVTNTTKE